MTDADVPRDPSSILRHDLINPVNQILGYADLLLIENVDGQGTNPKFESLHEIRDLGRRVRDTIDGALLRESDRPPDLRALADEVVGISRSIVEACLAIEGRSDPIPDREGFLDDLGRIREASAQLSEMVRRASASKVEGS